MKMYTVYALASSNDERIYIGLTGNLKRRLTAHNSGKTRATKNYRPWSVFHVQHVETLDKARALEKRYKTGFCREILKKILSDLLSARSSVG